MHAGEGPYVGAEGTGPPTAATQPDRPHWTGCSGSLPVCIGCARTSRYLQKFPRHKTGGGGGEGRWREGGWPHHRRERTMIDRPALDQDAHRLSNGAWWWRLTAQLYGLRTHELHASHHQPARSADRCVQCRLSQSESGTSSDNLLPTDQRRPCLRSAREQHRDCFTTSAPQTRHFRPCYFQPPPFFFLFSFFFSFAHCL